MKKYILFPILILISTGCTSSDEDSAAPERAEMKEVEVQIEGMIETINLRLLESPEEFPVQFSTYYPDDMQTEKMISGGGNGLKITAAFASRFNEEAHLTIFVFPESVSKEQADQRIRSYGGTPVDEHRYNWTEAEYHLMGEWTGFLALGKKEENWFYIHYSYPPEYGDGMGPRIDLVLNEWQWQDGSPLL